MLSEGHPKRGLPLARIASLLSEAPAKAMGLWGRKGAVAVGFDADFAIVDLAKRTEITATTVQSDAGYSLYEGWSLGGLVTDTLVRGRAVWRDGAAVEGSAGHGRFLRRSLG